MFPCIFFLAFFLNLRAWDGHSSGVTPKYVISLRAARNDCCHLWASLTRARGRSVLLPHVNILRTHTEVQGDCHTASLQSTARDPRLAAPVTLPTASLSGLLRKVIL